MGALASYGTSLRDSYVEKAGHLATTRLRVACPSQPNDMLMSLSFLLCLEISRLHSFIVVQACRPMVHYCDYETCTDKSSTNYLKTIIR